MPSLGELGGLTPAQYADLVERVDRFHAAWIPDAPADPAVFLPPPADPHRGHVLVELLKTDLELRAKAKLPARVEPYLRQFAADIPADAVPVSLLLEEYLIRHRFADRPSLNEYRLRFPAQYPALAEKVAAAGGPERFGSTIAHPEQTAVHAVPPPPSADSRSRGGLPFPLSATPEMPDEPVSEVRKRTKKPGKTKTGSKSRLQGQGRSHGDIAADTVPAELEYKLIRKLGQGTFGEVFEAEAPGGFRVALKKILRSLDHPASRGELESLEAIKTMTHPFLLQTQAFWVFRDRLIIVMELADGSLTDLIQQHRATGLPGVPPDELVRYFEQVAEAVDYLHSKNVSHRDIKPQNLLHLKGYAKLADFGLARMHEHTQTTVGSEMGTPLYMAPEAWNKKISLHSDQYSLAATYVAARLGRPLYTVKAMHELAMAHIHKTPDLDPLDAAEQAVLLKALAKQPDDRYPNCKAFVAALREAVFPPPAPSSVELAVAPAPRRTPWLAIGLAGVVLAGFAGLAAVVLNPPAAAPPPTAPERLFCPTGWTPNEAAGVVALPSGAKFHKELTREVGGETLVALVVLPVSPDDPPPFYILRDKVTNRVFRAVWDAAENDPASAVRKFLKRFGNQERDFLPGKWRDGALTLAGDNLGTTGAQAGVPVVGLTMYEAGLAAAELGGQLPTYAQWERAVTAKDGSLPDLFANAKRPPGGRDELTEAEFTALGVALGQSRGPWPIDRATPDVSAAGVRQLISNGFEWTRVDGDNRPVELFSIPGAEPQVLVVGQSWDHFKVPTLSDLANYKRSQGAWQAAPDKAIGFRVVFDAK